MSLRRSDVGSMPMSVAFCETNWSWLRRKKNTGTFNISEFVDRAVTREIALADMRGKSDATMLDVLDREQLFTYAIRILNRMQKLNPDDEAHFNAWGDLITALIDVKHETDNEVGAYFDAPL